MGAEGEAAVAPSPFEYVSPQPGRLTLRLAGADLQITESDTGREVARKPLAATSSVVVDGVDYFDDTLTIDFTGGLIPVPITDNGGIAGYDTLVIEGGRFKHADYQAINVDSGTILLDSEVIHYTGLEPITDNTTVDDRVFTDTTTGAQTIRLIDSGVAGTTKIDNPTSVGHPVAGFESVAFKNPANSLTINAGEGDDTIVLTSVAAGFAAKVVVNGGPGANTITGPDTGAVFTITRDHSGHVDMPAAVAFAADFHEVGTVKGGAGADTLVVQGDATFDGTLDGQGGSDSYTVNLGASLGAITIADSGATGSDSLMVSSPSSGDTLTVGGGLVTSTKFPGATVTYTGIDAAPATHVPSAFVAFIQAKANAYLGNSTLNHVAIPSADLDGFVAFGEGNLDISA